MRTRRKEGHEDTRDSGHVARAGGDLGLRPDGSWAGAGAWLAGCADQGQEKGPLSPQGEKNS